MRFLATMTSMLLLAVLCVPAGAWMGPGADGDDDGASPAAAITLVQMRLVQTGVASPSGKTDQPSAPTGMAAEVPQQPNTNPSGPGTIPGVPGAPRVPEVPVSPGTVPPTTTPTTMQPALFPSTTMPHVP